MWVEKSNLSTYRVDKALIELVEDYCSNRIPKIIKIQEPIIKVLWIYIQTNKGELRIPTIQELKNRLFQNSIKAVTIEYGICDRYDALVLITRFDRTSERSFIELTMKHDTPLETSEAVRYGLVDLISDNKNRNRFFYLKDDVLIPIMVLALMVGIGGILSGIKEVRSISIVFLALLLIYTGFFRFLVGYCSFDSKRQNFINATINWFFLAIAGFLFSTLLTPLRKTILGF